MWYSGRPAAEQCEGCTFFTTQVRELSALHARDVTYATICQGPYEVEKTSLDTLLVGRRVGMMHLVCYLRQGSDVFETYWTRMRGVEAMDNNYRLLDLTAYGRQEEWEGFPSGWSQRRNGKQRMRTDGRPTSQWPRLKAGISDRLSAD